MLLKRKILLILVLINSAAFGQVSVTFPMEKAVFQRNANNLANLYIAGTLTSTVDRVEARLLNPSTGGTIINWTTIQNNPDNYSFHGFLSNVSGGWYFLEVRGMLNGSQVGNTSFVSRVGIGEVFLIAGQSNAQGLEGFQGEVGATDERVVSHNYVGALCQNIVPDYPSFTQIFSNTTNNTRSYLGKTGPNPWCYGKLGDNLVTRLGVPVAFFNAGSMATSALNWMESADGGATDSHYSFEQYCESVGMPYNNLKIAFNYYASLFGVRAILWHQGETDNYAVLPYSNYLFNVNYLVNKTRSDFGADIPWVISKASVFDKNANGGAGNSSTAIISAQQDLVNPSNKIFSGPYTDDMLGTTRSDVVHFHNEGLIELANRWDAALDGTFFSSATPISAKPLPTISIGCASQTQLILTAPSGYSSYKWVNVGAGNTDYTDVAEATTQSITRSSGIYMCYLTDNNGNITFTQPYTVQNVNSICSCVGETSCTGVTYLSNLEPCSATNGWGPYEKDKSNGEYNPNDGNPITINGVTYAKGLGVHANSSITYNLNNNFGRFIADLGIDDEIGNINCTGGTVRFEVYKNNVLAYQSGIITNSSNVIKLNLDVRNTNQLKIVVSDAGDGFCADHADWAGARLHCVDTQAPTAPPTLTASNVGQACLTLNWGNSTDNMEVEKYYIYRNGVLIDSVASTINTYNITGLLGYSSYSFALKAKDYSGNISAFSNTLSVNTLPNPVILASVETISFGQSVTLSSGNCNGTIIWSNGQTGSVITVSPTDTTTYTAVCSTNGCLSGTSNTQKVNVIPKCKSNYNFISTANDYSSPVINYIFQASNTISATNLVGNRSKVEYKAAKSITLNPGFRADASTVFKATISNCPD